MVNSSPHGYAHAWVLSVIFDQTFEFPGAFTSDGRAEERALTGEEILGLYKWQTGDCFRCARAGVDVTPIGEIDTPIGDCYSIAACRCCVLNLERERRFHAARTGEEYVPGRLGAYRQG